MVERQAPFFWPDRPMGGSIVMQRCINNATGLLNASLPWGPLWLGEQRVCVRLCMAPKRGERKNPQRRRGGAELQAAQVTLVVSRLLCLPFFISLFYLLCPDTGQISVWRRV